MKKFLIFILPLILFSVFTLGCVQENEYKMPGKMKAEIMLLARKAILGIGFSIVYDDEAMGVIQGVKTTAGGTAAFINQGTGYLTSKPAGIQEMITLTVENEKFILRVETVGNTMYDSQGAQNIQDTFLKRMGIEQQRKIDIM